MTIREKAFIVKEGDDCNLVIDTFQRGDEFEVEVDHYDCESVFRFNLREVKRLYRALGEWIEAVQQNERGESNE